MKKPLGSMERWTVENTDNFDALLNCGTHVAGSCQRVDGAPSYNKCLMAYVVDGKNRLLRISDENGVTIGRYIFRLLQDDKTKAPALFIERFYPETLESGAKEALELFAKAEARRLGYPLYEYDEDAAEKNEASQTTLSSLGSPAPWKYVDSAGGIHENGLYSIKYIKPVS